MIREDQGAPASPSGHSAEPEPQGVSALRASVLSAGTRHPSLDITDEQEANLRKLAAYLWTLPADYPDFEMNRFTQDARGLSNSQAHVAQCGTAACAVGHGPIAGVAPRYRETWWEYSKRAFFGAAEGLFTWCADEDWSKIDNTVHGAAARIEWALAFGIPEDADEQRWGDEPICYASAIDARSGETGTGAIGEADESAVPQADAKTPESSS